MNLKEIERVVSILQASIFKRANSHTTGMIKSHFRGSGLQFREHQIYVPGDDVRFIDWKLSAKSSNIYLKTFEEDRNVEINVFFDLTTTLCYGDKGVSKLQACVEIAALLYLLAGQTHDLVKITIWADRSITLPPKKGKEGLTLLINTLEKLGVLDAQGQYGLDHVFESGLNELEKLNQLKASLAKRKEVLYLGDGYSFTQNDSIRSFLNMRNFHFFKIVSPIDLGEMPKYLFKSRQGSYWVGDNLEHKEPRIKVVRVDDRYLDRFVRELV